MNPLQNPTVKLLITRFDRRRKNNKKEALLREIKSYEDDIEKKNKLIEKLIEEEKIVRNWNIYQELVGKNGITKIVLRESLPIINNEIARLVETVYPRGHKVLDMTERLSLYFFPS